MNRRDAIKALAAIPAVVAGVKELPASPFRLDYILVMCGRDPDGTLIFRRVYREDYVPPPPSPPIRIPCQMVKLGRITSMGFADRGIRIRMRVVE